MAILSIILNILITMSRYERATLVYQEGIKKDFLSALEREEFDNLQTSIEKLVESYEKTPRPKQAKKKFGIESLKIFNLKNSQGKTAVMLAAEHGKAKLLEILWKVPDKLTDQYEEKKEFYQELNFSYITQDNKKRNALMLAIESRNPKCFEFLLCQETVDILNKKDQAKKTALMYAIESENFELIREFLEIAGLALGQENQYDPERKVKLEVDADTSKCIKNIKAENIKFLINDFLSKSGKFISYTQLPKLTPIPKRKNTEQNGTVFKKRREGGETILTVPEQIQGWIDRLEQIIDEKGSSGLTSIRQYINNMKKLTEDAIDLTPDYRSEIYQKLEKLEEKLQELSKSPNSHLNSETNVLANNSSHQK